MDMSGERRIGAPKETVWAALNDPAVLKSCIPGCESVEKLSETEMTATAMVTAGPLAETFKCKILLSDLDPPNGYTISGEGQAVSGGFAKGSARVLFADDTDGTRVSFDVKAELGGGLAQLEAGVIYAAAKQLADHFFTALASLLAAPAPVAGGPVFHMPHEDHDHDPSNPHYFGLPVGVIIAAVIAAISVGIMLAKFFL